MPSHPPLGLCPVCLLTSALSLDRDEPGYQPVSVIAEDADAITYLAQSLGAPGPPSYVALKILSTSVDGDAVLARFEQWKPALTSVRHRGLAPIVDAGVTGAGAVYLVSRFVAGSPLDVVAARPGVDRRQRIAIARHLVDAVAIAHDAGLVHLKIQPRSVKVALGAHVEVTILGLGSSLVLDDVHGSRENDLAALCEAITALGVDVQGGRFSDLAALRAAIRLPERIG